MLNKHILIRYGEISLKGKNRNLFENKLIYNIKDCLKKNKINYNKITKPRGRILIQTSHSCNCLKNVFGIVSFSPAISTDLNLDLIKKTALKLYKKSPFKISTQRLSKIFLTSQQLNEKVGAFIVKEKKAKVNLTQPKTEIGIEIINDKAYLFNKKIKALAGLPVNTSNLVTLLLENKDSIKAGYLMLKRGCTLEIIKKKNLPFKTLKKYSYGNEIKIIKNPSKNSQAIVVADSIKNIKKRKYKLPTLYPLLVYPRFKI